MGTIHIRAVFVCGRHQPRPWIRRRSFNAESELTRTVQQNIAHSLGPRIEECNRDNAYNPNEPTIQSTYGALRFLCSPVEAAVSIMRGIVSRSWGGAANSAFWAYRRQSGHFVRGPHVFLHLLNELRMSPKDGIQPEFAHKLVAPYAIRKNPQRPSKQRDGAE